MAFRNVLVIDDCDIEQVIVSPVPVAEPELRPGSGRP